MTTFFYKIVILIIFSTTIVFASDKTDPLQTFLKNFDSLESTFIQYLISEDNQLLESSEGIFQLQQPGKFNWTYKKPYAQKIISNGELLWVFDEDLKQLTINNISTAFEQTPAGIILANNNIGTYFTQVDMGTIETYRWIELIPKQTEGQYKTIRIGFDDGKLAMMVIIDNLGQTTRIDFINVRKNIKLLPSDFEFKIPSGIDVIDERAVIPIT